MARPTDGIVAAIFGRRGSGKTTRAVALTRPTRRLVVFDPIGEWSGRAGCKPCHTLDQVRRHLARHWRSGFRVAYVCGSQWPLRLHQLADWLLRAQAATGRRAPVLLAVDELSLSFPVNRLPAGQDAAMRACLQGRHHRLGVLGIAQRPADVSPQFRGQVAELWTFALPSELDRRAVAGMIGGAHLDTLRTLPDHEYLHLGRAGKVTRGRNAPVGRLRAS